MGGPEYLSKLSPSRCLSTVQSLAAPSISMTVRGRPVLPSHMVSLPVMPWANSALAASHSGSRESEINSLPSYRTE
jgi:hypothetical protein